MPTHGSLTKAGKVRDQVRRSDPRYGRSWLEKKKSPIPRTRNRRNYIKLLKRKQDEKGYRPR